MIFSHLGPRDLLRLSRTHSSLRRVTFDPSLWAHLHPIRWANGHLDFFPPPPFTSFLSEGGEEWGGGGEGEEGERAMMIHDAVTENDVVKELMSVEGKVNANLRGKGYMLRLCHLCVHVCSCVCVCVCVVCVCVWVCVCTIIHVLVYTITNCSMHMCHVCACGHADEVTICIHCAVPRTYMYIKFMLGH